MQRYEFTPDILVVCLFVFRLKHLKSAVIVENSYFSDFRLWLFYVFNDLFLSVLRLVNRRF